MMDYLLGLAGIYLGIGVFFALGFLLSGGVKRIDPAAVGATWGFRLVIFPGCVALWPLLVWRWVKGAAPPVERSAHRDAAGREETR